MTASAGTLAAAVVLGWVLADRRDEFVGALGAAPIWVLLVATLLQLVALVSRTEAWHVCVTTAGGRVGRRLLYRAASIGYLGSQLNSHLGTAARIAAMRRAAPRVCPRVPALIAAEVPILSVEAVLAAAASFTLVGPLGLPWWVPLACLAAAAALAAALGRVAGRWRHGFGSGLAVLRSLDGRTRVVALVLVAVFAQIGRNWLMLRAVGVDASVLDATPS